MIKLRLVGASTDLDHLVYTSHKRGRKGSHVAPIDDKLFDVLEDVVRERRARKKAEAVAVRVEATKTDSKLPPRDVQRLLRAGRSPSQVAKLAGVPVHWVEQFLGPVLYERAGMVQECQRSLLSKPRLGESGLPLGEAVAANLLARRVNMSEEEIADAWDARRLNSDPWQVLFTFRYRGAERRAVWRYDPGRRVVVAGNRLAADLGWAPAARKAKPSAAPASPRARKDALSKKSAARPAPARSKSVANAKAAKPCTAKAKAAKPGTAKAKAAKPGTAKAKATKAKARAGVKKRAPAKKSARAARTTSRRKPGRGGASRAKAKRGARR